MAKLILAITLEIPVTFSSQIKQLRNSVQLNLQKIFEIGNASQHIQLPARMSVFHHKTIYEHEQLKLA